MTRENEIPGQGGEEGRSTNSVSLFFNALADRFHRENHLSDITWAMCEASPAFRRLWIRFFFGDALDPDTVTGIRREVPSDDKGSRVDFLLLVKGGETYLIEVKIGDRNQHFGQYDDDYSIPSERLGYITNYPLKDTGDYRVRQWSAFCFELASADGIPAEDRELFDGYLAYLRKVCGIVMLTEKIELERMSALYGLTILVEELCVEKADGYESSYYKSLDRRDVRWLYFKVKYADFPDWPAQYLFLGIWFRDKEPKILGGFDKRAGWARQACDFLTKHKNSFSDIPLFYCTYPEKNDDWRLDLLPAQLNALRNAPTLDDQKHILKAYIRELIEFPIRLAGMIGENKD